MLNGDGTYERSMDRVGKVRRVQLSALENATTAWGVNRVYPMSWATSCHPFEHCIVVTGQGLRFLDGRAIRGR